MKDYTNSPTAMAVNPVKRLAKGVVREKSAFLHAIFINIRFVTSVSNLAKLKSFLIF